jgi:hypothetical protein
LRCFGSGQECLVGYFGLNRSLDVTSSMINASIIEPFVRLGFRTVSVAHFNVPSIINSPRSREHNVVASSFGIQNMDCELIWREPQREDCIEPLASTINANYPMRGHADSSGIMRKNALLQMHSQARLLAILRLMGLDKFRVFCLVRPDLLFLDEIPTNAIMSIADGSLDVITPGWHRWGGFNDRFALCSPRGAEVYLSRLNWVSRFCLEKGYFHPEEILQYSIEKAGLKYDFMPTRAKRVRSTGSIDNEDFTV